MYKNRKRLVTLHWLSDCLAKRKMEVPYKASHLPVTMYGLMVGMVQSVKVGGQFSYSIENSR